MSDRCVRGKRKRREERAIERELDIEGARWGESQKQQLNLILSFMPGKWKLSACCFFSPPPPFIFVSLHLWLLLLVLFQVVCAFPHRKCHLSGIFTVPTFYLVFHSPLSAIVYSSHTHFFYLFVVNLFLSYFFCFCCLGLSIFSADSFRRLLLVSSRWRFEFLGKLH